MSGDLRNFFTPKGSAAKARRIDPPGPDTTTAPAATSAGSSGEPGPQPEFAVPFSPPASMLPFIEPLTVDCEVDAVTPQLMSDESPSSTGTPGTPKTPREPIGPNDVGVIVAKLQRKEFVSDEEKYQRSDAVSRFIELLEPLATALDNLSPSEDGAKAYFAVLKDLEFMVAVCSIDRVLSCTATLSTFLQTVNADLTQVSQRVDDILARLRVFRTDDTIFGEIFQHASELLVRLFDEVPLLGKTKMRRYKLSTSEDVQAYLRRTVFYPLVDTLTAQMERRFKSAGHEAVAALSCLVPTFAVEKSYMDLAPAVHFYAAHLDFENAVREEFEMWKSNWMSRSLDNSGVPDSAIQAFVECDERFYPNIKTLLKILATLPISTASPERSFSALRRLKTWLRNRTGDERLSALALLNIHAGKITVDPDDAIDIFAQRARRLNFVL